MKTKEYLIVSALTIAVLVGSALGIVAQSKMDTMKGKPMDMSKMMKSPHHMLMTAHMKSMSEFTRTLRDQAAKPEALDVEFARAAVTEIRHCLDAMETVHQKHKATMSDEMKANMKMMMMNKMEKSQIAVKEHVAALEAAVQAGHSDAKQVVIHTDALLKQLDMMSKMSGGSKAEKKMVMKQM